MRTFIFALVGTALSAAVVVGLRLDSQATSAIEAQRPANVERFVMQASGDANSCLVEKTEGSLSQVHVAPDCDRMLPGVSGLRYWRESADGTVTLSTDGVTPVVVFAEADGVAYESIEPRTPLIALISGN